MSQTNANQYGGPGGNDLPARPARPPTGRGGGLGRRIWHRKGILLVCIGIGIVGGLIKYTLTRSQYTSTAQISIETSGSADRDDAYAFLKDQAQLIQKPVVLIIARDTPGLKEMKTFAHREVLPVFKESLRAYAYRGENVIHLSFQTPFREEANAILDAVINAYRQFTAQRPQGAGGKAAQDVEGIAQDVQAKLKALEDFRATANLPSADPAMTNAMKARLQDLQNALSSAEYEREMAEGARDAAIQTLVPADIQQELRRTGRVQSVKPIPGADEQEARTDLQTARERLARLRATMQENSPQIAQEQRIIRSLAVTYASILWHKADMAHKREDRIRQIYSRQKTAVDNLDANLARYQQMESDLQRSQSLWDQVQHSRRPGMGTSATGVQVAAAPSTPESPSSPILPLLALEGAAAGLLLGLIASLADPRLSAADEVWSSIGLPVLGIIPHMPPGQTPMSRGRKVYLEPVSDVADACRQLHEVACLAPGAKRAKTILITSPTRGEGRTTLASNLATAMAETGQRVLLLDADLREPMLHRIFGVSAEKGLSSLICGRCTIDRAVQATAAKNLDILPCGPLPLNPAELINSQGFADILDTLAKRYDRVVIDSPPVSPLTDSRIISASSDLTILVMRPGKSMRRAGRDARDGLLGFGANVLGVVVNDESPRRGWSSNGNGSSGRQTVDAAGHPIMIITEGH